MAKGSYSKSNLFFFFFFTLRLYFWLYFRGNFMQEGNWVGFSELPMFFSEHLCRTSFMEPC